MALANLIVKIGADISELQTGMDKTVRTVEKAGSQISNLANNIQTAFIGAFSVTAITGFVSHVADVASQIHDMASALGVSAEAVQRFKFAAEQSGASIDDVGRSINFMNKALSAGDKSTVAALRDAGLSLADLQRMRPEDAFLSITDAVKAIPNPMLQAEVSAKLFGKTALALAPAIKEGFRDLGNSASVMSTDTVNSLEAAQDAWGKLADRVVIVTGTMIGHTLSMTKEVTSSVGSFAKFVENFIKGGSSLALAMAAADAAGTRAVEAAAATAKALPPVTRAHEELTDAQKKAAAAATAHAKEIGNLRDELSGRGAIKSANDMLEALRQMGPVQNLTAEAQKKINDTIGKSIEVYTAQGKVAPDALRSVYSLTLDVSALAPKIVALSDAMGQLGARVPIPVFDDLSTRLTYLAGIPWGAKIGEQIDVIAPKVQKAAETITDSLGGALAKIPALFQQAFTGGSGLIGAMKALGLELADAISTPIIAGLTKVKQAAVSVGQAAATAFGGATGGGMGAQVAGVAAGLGGAAASAGLFGTAIAGSTIAIGAMTLGIGAAAVGAAVLIKHFTDSKGRKAVKEFADSFGSFDALHDKLKLLGEQGEQMWISITQGTGRGDKAAAQKAIGEIQGAFARLSEAIDKYGLSWKDLGESARQSHVTDYAKELLADFNALTGAGFNVTNVLKGQSGALNQLIVDAVETGTKIPPAMQPILEKLIRMGGLTDDAARAMLGLEASTMPSLQNITDAAGRYGLSLDALGPKVQQLRISETAAQIVSDFNLLIASGADVGVVMGGMQEKVQGLVTSALSLGLSLPESMRPLIDKMIEAGLLTDDLGGKLGDTSRIKFAKPLSESIDTMVEKMGELIQTITDKVAPTLENIGRTRIPPVRIPYTFEQEGPNPPGTAVPRPASAAGANVLAFPSILPSQFGINTASAAAAGVEGGGDIIINHQTVLDGRVIDERITKVTRKDAATGGLQPRSAGGRSY